MFCHYTYFEVIASRYDPHKVELGKHWLASEEEGGRGGEEEAKDDTITSPTQSTKSHI